jgi:hypothetical protein
MIMRITNVLINMEYRIDARSIEVHDKYEITLDNELCIKFNDLECYMDGTPISKTDSDFAVLRVLHGLIRDKVSVDISNNGNQKLMRCQNGCVLVCF